MKYMMLVTTALMIGCGDKDTDTASEEVVLDTSDVSVE